MVAALAAVAYYLTARIGFVFALQPGPVSTLWMPNSILLATLLLVPKRSWWIVLVAVLPAHFASELQSGLPVSVSLALFLSNSAQALIGAIGIRYFVRDRLRFDRFRDLVVFVLFGAFLAPFLSSFLDIGAWRYSSYWEIWRIRFFSNVLAAITLIPVIVTWAEADIKSALKSSLGRWVEVAILTAGLLSIGIAVFSSNQLSADKAPWLLYCPLPFLLWAAVRFGPIGTSTSILVVMFLAIFGATHGQGPFIENSSAYNALSIQGFLIVVALPLLALAGEIEERRRAEASSRKNEERLAMAMTAARMGTWEWDIQGNTAKWSNESKRMFGLSPVDPETIGEEFYQMIHPDDRSSVEEAINRAIYEGTPYEADFRIPQPDGSVRWVRGRGKVLRDEAGKPSRMIGLNADITERKNGEQALWESNERNQAILRALPDMMFLQTTDGDYLDYYTRDDNRLLVPPEAFLGKNVRDVLPPELAERILACMSRVSGKDEPQVFEYSLQLGEEERHFEARLVATEGDKVLSIIRDVTEARRAADALRESEEKLLESHRHIRALAASLMSAEDSERTRIAHLLHDDVSQNVAAFGVAISRLKRKLADGNPEIVAELDRLGHHTNDLTTQIRRLSHQLQPEVLESLGLVATLESEAADFRHEEQITVKINADIRRDLPLDVSVCLYRVTLEALRNVSRHSGANLVNITLREEDAVLTLEISDAGRGFDVEKAKRESGIGLASAEERVKLLQGTFEIRSKPEAGTTLIARVPLAR
jgi:PAS domain S-box-containing protein